MLTPRERFSVAHELGHWVAYSRLKIKPEAKGERYWEHERAVNAFAASLLVPDWLVTRWLDEVPEGMPVCPFALRKWASLQCRCSEEVVAKALVKCGSSIGFLKLLPTTRKKDGTRVLRVLCSAAGSKVRLPSEHAHIENPDFQKLLDSRSVGEAQLKEVQLGRCNLQNLRIAWRRGRPLGLEPTTWLSILGATSATETQFAPAQLSMDLAPGAQH